MMELVQGVCAVEIHSRQGQIFFQTGMLKSEMTVFDNSSDQYRKMKKIRLSMNTVLDCDQDELPVIHVPVQTTRINFSTK